MNKKLIIATILIIGCVSTYSQELFMPRNVKIAYNAGLRSKDGKPNAAYFQNSSTHNIRLFVAPPSRRVVGTQDIVFKNNSPVALPALFFRFELNAHKPEAPREKYMDEAWLTDDIQIDEYAENGNVRPWAPLMKIKGATVNAVFLEKPLAPGQSITLSFRWHYDLSVRSDREGAIDQTTFYLAYFYPRVAVFDNVNNWDQVPHPLAHEFYSDFNDYNVEITVPKNFVVWGTGDLTNIDEVLQPTYATRLKRSFTSDDVIKVATFDEMKARNVTTQTSTVTWKFKSSFVPDVAYAISDSFAWDAGSVVVDKNTGRRASAQSVYDAPSKNFVDMVKFIKTALDFASNDWPGIPYPYPKMTVVRGFADMEYPMMANDSAQEEPNMQQFIAAHEILHTYFPFYMGINERRYGFMEEGWTTAFEYLFTTKVFGKEYADPLFKKYRVLQWTSSNTGESDIPIITDESALSGLATTYGDNKYGRAALGYLALKDMLGDTDFRKGLHGFMRDWNGKHPIPWDMFYSFNAHTGKDLNWFWTAWFFSNGYIDHSIKDVKRSSDGTSVTVRNGGGCPAPFDLAVTFTDGSTELLHQGSDIWKANLEEAVVRVNQAKIIKSIVIDGGIFMDANPADNRWESK